MNAGYQLLHYAGNVTGSEDAQPGRVLGGDGFGRPYEVLDAEYDPATDRTTVHLQYATPDTLRREMDRLNAQLQGGGAS